MREVDLDAAVEAGIITGEQASALREGFARPSPAGNPLGGEEFQIARTFGEIFVALGIMILAGGFALAVTMTKGFVAPVGPFAAWMLAELVLVRHRLAFPGAVLGGLFAVSVLGSLAILRVPESLSMLAAALGAIAYLVRFKVPFAAFVSGASFLGFIVLVIGRGHLTPLATLVAGLAMFVSAMALDSRDPLRRDIHSHTAFWLHLLAAPLIVSGLMLQLDGTASAYDVLPIPNFMAIAVGMSVERALSILGIAATLSLVALLIDRRALLVSSLGYLGAVLGYGVSSVGGTSVGILATLFILGAGVIFLGLGWRSIRAGLLRRLPRNGLLARLPSA